MTAFSKLLPFFSFSQPVFDGFPFSSEKRIDCLEPFGGAPSGALSAHAFGGNLAHAEAKAIGSGLVIGKEDLFCCFSRNLCALGFLPLDLLYLSSDMMGSREIGHSNKKPSR